MATEPIVTPCVVLRACSAWSTL